MITKEEVLMGRIAYADLPEDKQKNLDKLVKALNIIRAAYGKPMYVSSGYRSADANKKAGGAKNSLHMSCLACDFKDADGSLDAWSVANQDVLKKAGLWLEHPDDTQGWTHYDLKPRTNRIFKP